MTVDELRDALAGFPGHYYVGSLDADGDAVYLDGIVSYMANQPVVIIR